MSSKEKTTSQVDDCKYKFISCRACDTKQVLERKFISAVGWVVSQNCKKCGVLLDDKANTTLTAFSSLSETKDEFVVPIKNYTLWIS